MIKAITPKNWDDLVKIMNYIRDCSWEFLRFEEDEKKYQDYKNGMDRVDFLKVVNKKFGGKKIVITKNDFNYTKLLQNLPKVGQYVLWSVNGKIDEGEIKKLVENRFGGKKWCWMERSERGKSIPEIWHCHVFVDEG